MLESCFSLKSGAARCTNSKEETCHTRRKEQLSVHTLAEAGEPHPPASAPGPPCRAPPCLCHPRRPSRPSEEGPAPHTSVSQPELRDPTVPPQFAHPPHSPPTTTPASVPSASRAAQSRPGRRARILSLSAALHTPRATASLAPRAAFPAVGGERRAGDAVGGTRGAGRAQGVRSLPSGARLDPA